MNKKNIVMLGVGLIAGTVIGSVHGTWASVKMLTRSGIPMTSAPDVLNILRKYEYLGYTIAQSGKEFDVSPEAMMKFITVMIDVFKEEGLLDDPRFEKVAIQRDFDRITKGLTMGEE